jgi:hypothetical protein
MATDRDFLRSDHVSAFSLSARPRIRAGATPYTPWAASCSSSPCLVSFIFHLYELYESPKFLMGRGRDADAVEVVHKVAAYNDITSNLPYARYAS